MPPLQFDFDESLSEIQAIRDVASDFIDIESREIVLQKLARDLEVIRTFSQGTAASWAIAQAKPLRTTMSYGGYERGDGGQHNVFGEVSSTWTIAPADPAATKRRPAKTFAVVGNASVCIRIKESRPEGQRELAMWRLELGADDAPGCFFHTQVLGESGRVEPPFPHSLSVPRLPALAFTPAAALEFVIGELFQEAWREHASKETPGMNRWRNVQQVRFMRLLWWKYERVRQSAGSPWAALKRSKPPIDLFLARSAVPPAGAMVAKP